MYPTAANFVLIRCVGRPAREVFRRLYDDHGILVRDVSNAGELAECLRISIGTDDDMDAVVLALAEIFAEADRRMSAGSTVSSRRSQVIDLRPAT